MATNKRTNSLPPTDKLKKAALALEDFLSSLRQTKVDGLETALDALIFLASNPTGSVNTSAVARSYQSSDPNKHFLIGALPRLLLDKDLFPTNDDIVDFAKAALRIEMKVEKRARFDIIGKIVCETDSFDEQQLTDLVRALERLVGDKARIAMMVEKKKEGSFSWNETLQDLMRS
jgi:hypothetical protein